MDEFSLINDLMLHEHYETGNYFITRVVGGWIYTDRRNSEAPSGVFVPMSQELDWGYSIPYAITGQLNQHPRAAIKWRAGDAPDDYVAFYDQLEEE